MHVKSDDAPARMRLPTAALETGLILVGLAALLVLLPHHVFSDGEVRLQSLTQLLEHGTLSPARYSLIGPLFATPIWLVGTRLHIKDAGVGIYNWVVFTAGLAAAYWLLRNRMDQGLIRKFFLILIAASMFPNHLTEFYGEVFTAICIGVGILAMTFGPALGGWAVVVLGVANTPASLVALGGVVVTRVFQRRRVRYVLAVLAAAGLIAAEYWVRRGSPTAGGYESDPGFTFPFFIGLISILFSFGKGLIFFTPGLLLPVRKSILALRKSAPESRSAPSSG